MQRSLVLPTTGPWAVAWWGAVSPSLRGVFGGESCVCWALVGTAIGLLAVRGALPAVTVLLMIFAPNSLVR